MRSDDEVVSGRGGCIRACAPRAALVVVAALNAACAVSSSARVPARVVGDELDPGLVPKVVAAREALDQGDTRGALRAVAEVGAAGADAVDLQRVRQDALRQRGRLGLARAEAGARVADAPADGIAHYLLGRLSTGAAMTAEFVRATELAPDRLWPWLGRAFALREAAPAESLAIYADLYAASDREPVVAIGYANTLRSLGRVREAAAVYEDLAARPDTAGIGQLGLAQSLFASGGAIERQRGWMALLAAVELRPFDPGVHVALRELLRLGIADEQVEQCLDVLRIRPDRWGAFARGAGIEVLLELLQRTQQPFAALRLLETAGVSARQPALRREQRRLLLQVGDVRGFLAMLQHDLPADMMADEENQVRARWRTLLDGPWRDRDPLGDVATASGLCAALRDAGLLVEAESFAELARRHVTGDLAALDAVRDEVRREIAFEDALRRMLYDGYASTASDLDAVLARTRELSLATLGTDVVGADERFVVPLVGEMLDPFRAGLCVHLARYNRHLVLGRRSGGAVEGLMVTRLSVRDLKDGPELPVPGRCREVIGCDRSVRSLSGVLGGDLAGVALLNHYIVDHDAVAEWAAAVASRRRIAAEDDNAVLGDPVPAGTAELDPLDVGWRLAAMSPLQDSGLDAAVLEVIRLHERRHLVDAFHYLPFEANVWRGLGLLLRFGLSPSAIEAEMERRAELAALALSQHPELVLGHIAEFVGEDEASPHARGFTQLAADLIGALVAEGVAEADAAVSRWDRLDPAVVRRSAARLLAQLP